MNRPDRYPEPRRLQAELADREIIDYDVLPFSVDGERRVVVLLVGPRPEDDIDLGQLRRELEQFDSLRRRLRIDGRGTDKRSDDGAGK